MLMYKNTGQPQPKIMLNINKCTYDYGQLISKFKNALYGIF